MAWSKYQTAIFDFVEDANAGNGAVEAVAGSGKTTTIVEALKRVKGTSIFLAFNKSIADELKARGVNARTFHSLTYNPVMQDRGQFAPDMNKLRKIFEELNPDIASERMYGQFCYKLVGLARQIGVGCLVEDIESVWTELCEHHNIELEHEMADFKTGILLARDLLRASNASRMVDFDDMLYFAVKDGISLPKFDFVFVDEAQDTNAIQRAILRKILKPTSRIVVVGDPAQAIYGFRGADSDSMQLISEEFNCKSLPLTITYRCPLAVVRYAQQWVPHIEARPDAEEGIAETLEDWTPEFFRNGDLVVCRKTGPLIATAFKFIRANKPVQVMGREIGQGLKSLIKKMNVDTIDALEEKLEAYMQREVEKAQAKKEYDKAEGIADRVGSLLFLLNGLKEDRRTIEDLESGIDYLFANKSDAVILATIHKSKGLEADRVFWLDRSSCPSKWAKQAWQKQQEENLCYVAATRAKKELYFLELPRNKTEEE